MGIQGVKNYTLERIDRAILPEFMSTHSCAERAIPQGFSEGAMSDPWYWSAFLSFRASLKVQRWLTNESSA